VSPQAPSPAAGLTGFTPAEEKALRITTTLETGRQIGFGGLTGNFDGMGLSFGLLQWNIGKQSLQPLLSAFASSSPARFDAVFGADAGRMRSVLAGSLTDQMQWARSVNDQRNHITEPWRTHFDRLAADPEFRRIELRAVRPIMDAAKRSAQKLGIVSERGLALMFDNVTQNGPRWLGPQRLAAIQKRSADGRAAQGRGVSERELLGIVANVVADTVLPRWREDVRRRRMTIVNGTGVVHGTRFDLGRQFGLTDQPWEPAQPAPQRAVAGAR
jgi:hypothetical protein